MEVPVFLCSGILLGSYLQYIDIERGNPMSREKECYRENMEQLNRIFPNYEMLTLSEVMQVLKYRSPNTVRKYLRKKFVNGKLSKTALARYMCG